MRVGSKDFSAFSEIRRAETKPVEQSFAVGLGPAPRTTKGAAPSFARGTAKTPAIVQALSSERRTFDRVQGEQINTILVAPEAQAHVVLDNHPLKKMVVLSQPSGNVGAAWWWNSDSIKTWQAKKPAEAIVQDGKRGVRLVLEADAPGTLLFEPPILDSVRAIRDRLGEGSDERVKLRKKGAAEGLVPANAVAPRAVSSSETLVLERENISGTHTHRLEIRGLDGTTVKRRASGEIEVASKKGAPKIEVTYSTDLPQLTPFAPLDFLAPKQRERLIADLKRAERGGASPEERAALNLVTRALEDLSSMVFHEKAVAGGWRFLTYFGRDTLQTMTMLRPLLDPTVVESVFQAALERLSPEGSVAHEEDLADQAEHVRLERALAGKKTPSRSEWSAPINDYKMVDDDFMLASAVAEYLADGSIPPEQKRRFLDKTNARGETNLTSIARNLSYAAALAEPYAKSVRDGSPDATKLIKDPLKLIKIRDDGMVGDWRDSEVGLALGRYPASINLELVGTSLKKMSAMIGALGGLGYDVEKVLPSLGENAAEELQAMSAEWNTAREHYRVSLSPVEISQRLARFLRNADPEERDYFSKVDLGNGATVGELASGTKVLADSFSFSAVSLDAEGRPVPVISSDGFFGLIGSEFRPEAVAEVSRLVTTPYPLGLATPAGLLISNPVLAGKEELDDLMGPGRYHGAVIWTWLEALGLSALGHQKKQARAAGDLGAMRAAERALASIDAQVDGSGQLQTSELHGWALERGKLVARPFEGAENESLEAWPGNATQLWATALPLVRWARSHGSS